MLATIAQQGAAAEIGMAELPVEEQRRGIVFHGERATLQPLVGQAAVVKRQRPEFAGHGVDP